MTFFYYRLLGLVIECYWLLPLVSFLSIVAKQDHSNDKCLVVALSTHGDTTKVKSAKDYGMEGFIFYDEVERLYGTDEPFEFSQLTSIFNEKNCPSLKGKPKLFFLQVSMNVHNLAYHLQNGISNPRSLPPYFCLSRRSFSVSLLLRCLSADNMLQND